MNAMIGTIVNTVCIVIGSVVGSQLKRGVSPRLQESLYNALGLVTLALGANVVCQQMPKSRFPVLFIVSMAVGTLIGNRLDIDGHFKRLVERLSKSNGAQLAQGLSTACLLFCIGTFSIVGPMLSALYDDNTFLFTNATLDIISSCVLATTYGIGIALSAVVLFVWQGMFYALALAIGSVVPDYMMTEVVLVGGILLISSGLSLLKVKECHTLNMLPALLVPPLFFVLQTLITS